jgi:hypothetical protein
MDMMPLIAYSVKLNDNADINNYIFTTLSNTLKITTK